MGVDYFIEKCRVTLFICLLRSGFIFFRPDLASFGISILYLSTWSPGATHPIQAE